MPKTIHITPEALQLGSTGNQNIGASRCHEEKHKPLGQSNSHGTQEISTWVKPQDKECV